MTSKLPEQLLNDLGDVRQKYADDEYAQNLALSRTYPAPFNRKNIENAPSYQPGQEFTFNLNLDAAVVILRHLYSLLHVQQRHSDAIAQEELAHPILRFIWADFESGSTSVAQSILRYEMQLADDPKGELTVFKLFERPAMWDSLWARRAFRLYHPTVLGKGRDAEEWRIVDSQENVIEESLVRWDGATNLGDYISALVGYTIDRVTQHRFIEFFGDPGIIRVRYQHTSDRQPPATYEDLRQIHIKPQRYRHAEDDPSRWVIYESEEPIRYMLVAVVRCSTQATEADQIRLYSIIGNPLSLPMDLKNYAGTHWNINKDDPGRIYLLFYARAIAGTIHGLQGEIARKEPNTGSLIEEMMGSTILKRPEAGGGSS
ncbi:hypothetical protein SAMD00023353_4900870 [Rosellinia necatrix]|uniref:Uncharacterized protein n=1 Tax=Rosellinia necatrix TaxID=77044 RepID=A0A1W2TPL1_ROSNE|nr:hypothetical protein SAMD00023353_4900870 [Rosellinia necatrix]